MMRVKLALIVGAGIGYVLGTRAGRQRYEQIKRAAGKMWHDPRVQQQVHQAEDFAREKAPEVVGFLGESAKKVASKAGGRRKPTDSSPTMPMASDPTE
jgi:hypothetical protein